VVIFDYDKIQDRSTYEQPDLPPDGIDYVLVNGVVVIDHGKHTGARPGKVLCGPGYTAQQNSASVPAPPSVAAPNPQRTNKQAERR